MKVAVLYGGLSPEREISLKSGLAVAGALRRRGFDVIEIDVDRNLPAALMDVQPDCVFVALHGPMGEDGTVQGLLEVLGIPYTGSGVLGSALAMDKLRSKLIFSATGIPTPEWTVVHPEENALPSFSSPWVVKPSGSGSSIGVSIVSTAEELKKAVRRAAAFSHEIIVEKYCGTKELTVAVLEGEALGVLEIHPKKGFYNFDAKYTAGATEYLIPPRVSQKIQRMAMKVAEQVFNALALAGAARIDMRADDSNVYVLEANTIPGMTETSLLPKIAAHAGMDFDTLCEVMVRKARTHVRV